MDKNVKVFKKSQGYKVYSTSGVEHWGGTLGWNKHRLQG